MSFHQFNHFSYFLIHEESKKNQKKLKIQQEEQQLHESSANQIRM